MLLVCIVNVAGLLHGSRTVSESGQSLMPSISIMPSTLDSEWLRHGIGAMGRVPEPVPKVNMLDQLQDGQDH